MSIFFLQNIYDDHIVLNVQYVSTQSKLLGV